MDEAYRHNVFPDACLGECSTPEKCACKEKKKAAFEKAHEIRQFEIDLYWRRSLYFWGFQAGFFAAYSLIFSALSDDMGGKNEKLAYIAMFIVACLGLIVSILWHFLEKGSKAWQENWEHHIDQLEDEFTGRLHKIVLGKAEDFYSVTKINQRIIFFIGFAWLCLAAVPPFVQFCNPCLDLVDACCCALFIFVCMIFAILLFYFVFMDCKISWIKIKSSFPNEEKHGETKDGEGIGEDKKINIYYRWKKDGLPRRKRQLFSRRKKIFCFLGVTLTLSLFLGFCCLF